MKLKAVLALAALGLAACGGKPVADSTAAEGKALEDYSRNISRAVSIDKDGPLVQRFCKNATGAACPDDVAKLLSQYDYADGAPGVDMANAFAVMLADQKDSTPDKTSSDEDYLAAAYRVALAREPDAGGALTNLQFIKDGGERKMMLRSLLESAEFKNQK